ncbi:MAG: glycosyltransferase family 4 protein [Gammaproteobacteria bacterium]|nr:glycosyltransferase family 4 protein [Gammaproteobacteria bacterium]MBU1440751.1 glycosyltransferase family 4 protein [Gammaproteobacteria bacterium]MBU2285943.1 glycosyltransferase family 4 protein [Gammaproteobacteria bacterium]MBU2407382.1 glycosyltransferase family 4 protein [Gammaproteobacteria bacterium]
MKVLLYSHAFDPSIGGVETVSRALVDGLLARGVECKVVTHTAEASAQPLPFEVVRRPARPRIQELVRWADVVLFNGASLALQPWVILSRKPFIWVHVGYQACCLDGAGWLDGAPTPLEPFASIAFHARRSGPADALKNGVKLLVRRAIAKYGVTRNVAITQWMNTTLPLPRQVQIYNPFPIERFHAADRADPDYEFFYMGRLVDEKGVATLIRAFAKVRERAARPPRLLLIGDGTARHEIEALVGSLGLKQSVDFVGTQSGQGLVDWVARGMIGVIPSIWYEPMGGVAVELMAAGKSLIVSAKGGLAECVGDAGLTFPNGDDEALAVQMLKVLDDPALRSEQQRRARERAKLFVPARFVGQYHELLKEVSKSP